VANYRSDSVSRIDAATGRPKSPPIHVGRGPFGVAAGFGAIWVTNEVDRSIVRIDPRTNHVSRPVPIGNAPRGIDVGEEAVWAAAAGARAVFELDPRTRDTTQVTIGRFCQDVAVAAGSVWVVTPQENQVMRIDPVRRHIAGRPVEVGLSPSSIDYGGGVLWVANSGEGTVSRIDPRRARVVGKPIRAGRPVSDLTVRGRNVWVLRTDGAVRRLAP
jgi:YVTN family beta-propeller protein